MATCAERLMRYLGAVRNVMGSSLRETRTDGIVTQRLEVRSSRSAQAEPSAAATLALLAHYDLGLTKLIVTGVTVGREQTEDVKTKAWLMSAGVRLPLGRQ